MKENIFGKDLSECESLMLEMGEAKFRGRQLYQWLYENRSASLSEMTNFSNKLREKLSERYRISHGEIIDVQKDNRDGTKKYLIRLEDDQYIEAVLMHYDHGASLCVSTQVGCNMGCKFCASTKGGKIRDLTAGEILDQIYLAEKEAERRIANIVIMGIGEPLENYREVIKFVRIANDGFGIGQRKISLSTCGIIPGIEDLANENLQINLAISLHSVFQDRRKELMPISNKYGLESLLKTCKKYFEKTGRRITYEYALIEGCNDRDEDIRGLVSILKGTQAHLNLIGLNEIQGAAYNESGRLNYFKEELEKQGINVTLRRKMGREIDAACGQLRKKRFEDKVSV